MNDYSVILICLNSFLIYRICKCTKIELMLKFLLVISYFSWNALPLILSMQPEYKYLITIPENLFYFFSNVNQVSLFLIYLFAYLLIVFKKKRSQIFSRDDFQSTKSFNNIVFFFSISCLLFEIYSLYSTELSYSERNEISFLRGDISRGVVTFIYSAGTNMLLAQLLLLREKLSKKQIFFGAALLMVYYLMQIYNGRRIFMFAIVFFFLYIALQKQQKRLYLLSFILLSFAFVLLPQISKLRQGTRITFEILKQNNEKVEEEEILSEFLIKTNSVLYTSYLLLHDGIGNIGPQLYTSTVYSLIPRFLYPQKPEPGSIDGTLYGLPSRLSAAYNPTIKDDYNEISNNGVSTPLVALWAMGWGMLFFQIIVSAFIIWLFNELLKGRKPLFAYYIFSLTGFPVCVLDISLISFLMTTQRFIVIYIFLYVFLNKRKSIR